VIPLTLAKNGYLAGTRETPTPDVALAPVVNRRNGHWSLPTVPKNDPQRAREKRTAVKSTDITGTKNISRCCFLGLYPFFL
jgi:hypothetical protein